MQALGSRWARANGVSQRAGPSRNADVQLNSHGDTGCKDGRWQSQGYDRGRLFLYDHFVGRYTGEKKQGSGPKPGSAAKAELTASQDRVLGSG